MVIDWDSPVMAWEVILGALVQVVVVLLTVLLTLFVTRGHEARADRRSAEARYRDQLDRYLDELHDVTDMIVRVARANRNWEGENFGGFSQFMDRVRWVPRPEHAVVDSWVRTQLFSAMSRLGPAPEGFPDDWDDLAEHHAVSFAQNIPHSVGRWIDGTLSTEWFRESLDEGNVRVSIGRVSALESPPEGRFRRVAEAAKTGWRGVILALRN